MAQRFTYFRSDGTSEIRTQPKGPLPQAGEAWVRGAYGPPDSPSALNVRVGKAGIKVWMVILWHRLHGSNKELLLGRYGEVLDPADVDTALWFYERNRAEIDQRIEEEMQPV